MKTDAQLLASLKHLHIDALTRLKAHAVNDQPSLAAEDVFTSTPLRLAMARVLAEHKVLIREQARPGAAT